MASELRKTGINYVGDVPWGTHFCHFYETKQDLLDILLQYFRTGLENNEFCIWVVSHPLGEGEARRAFREAIADADRYLAAGHVEIVQEAVFPAPQQTSQAASIEIVPWTEWYLKGGAFVAERVIDGWNKKLTEALARGFDGLRVNGNESWLTEENRKDFLQYEKKLDEKLAGQRMIVLCSYPLSGSGAGEILDVARTHQFAVVRRRGNWEVVETAELKQAREEINRLNEELEKRVAARTRELGAANEQLTKEIAERLRAEDRIRLIIDTISVMAWSVRPDGVVDFLNQRWIDYAGLSLEEYTADPARIIHPEDVPRVMEKWAAQMALGHGYDDEMRLRRADGEYRWFLVRTEPLRDESGKVVKWYGVSTDIERRKQAEEELRATSEQLRALSTRMQSAKEEEATRIAREIHDELGGTLTSLRWDLEEVGDRLSESADSSQLTSLRKKIAAMTTLTETTVDSVRRLVSELRPMALDELGLPEAIEWQARQFETRTGIAVSYECSLENVGLNTEQSTAVFRILQEALTNILRHAQATKVAIAVKQEAREVLLTIEDNGRGIAESEKSDVHSLGLLGMRERAHLIGAEIEVSGKEGKGTLVVLRVPLSGSVS
jgi:PAS domain S-box-containing protein